MSAQYSGRKACRQTTVENCSSWQWAGTGFVEGSANVAGVPHSSDRHLNDLTFRDIDMMASPSGAIPESSDAVDEGLNRALQLDIVQVTDHQIHLRYG